MNATEAELAGLQKQIAAGRRPANEFYWHPTMRGFGLRVYANGAGRWVVQYRNARGQTKRYQIPGSAAAITLKQATNLATIIFGDIARGLDPQGQRQEMREKPKFTFNAIAKRFLDEGKGIKGKKLSPTTHGVYSSIFKNYIGRFGTMQVDEIEKFHVNEKVKEAEKISAHTAVHTRAFISIVYKWGTVHSLISVPNPAQTPTNQSCRNPARGL